MTEESDSMTASRPMLRPRMIAVANQKGGVGKTTTAINLGAAFAERGYETLLIDLDPQGNASTGLGCDVTDRTFTIHDVISGEVSLLDSFCETSQQRLRLVPASHKLSSFEMALANQEDRLNLLKDILFEDNNLHDEFSYVLFDCPPALNLLTLNAMVAAHSVLAPLQAEFFALQGLSQLISSMRQVRQSANPHIHLEGVVLTMFDRRNNLSRQVESDARQNLQQLVFKTVIPRAVRLSEAPSHGLPALHYDTRSAGSTAYRELADEILRNHTK